MPVFSRNWKGIKKIASFGIPAFEPWNRSRRIQLGRKQVSNTVLLAEAGTAERGYFESILKAGQHTIRTASDLTGLRKYLMEGGPVDAILLGGFVPGAIPINLFRDIRRRDPSLPVIVIFGLATPREIADVMKCGATNVLVKPVSEEA